MNKIIKYCKWACWIDKWSRWAKIKYLPPFATFVLMLTHIHVSNTMNECPKHSVKIEHSLPRPSSEPSSELCPGRLGRWLWLSEPHPLPHTFWILGIRHCLSYMYPIHLFSRCLSIKCNCHFVMNRGIPQRRQLCMNYFIYQGPKIVWLQMHSEMWNLILLLKHINLMIH